MYVQGKKHTVYIGFGTICSFKQLLGSWSIFTIPQGWSLAGGSSGLGG